MKSAFQQIREQGLHKRIPLNASAPQIIQVAMDACNVKASRRDHIEKVIVMVMALEEDRQRRAGRDSVAAAPEAPPPRMPAQNAA